MALLCCLGRRKEKNEIGKTFDSRYGDPTITAPSRGWSYLSPIRSQYPADVQAQGWKRKLLSSSPPANRPDTFSIKKDLSPSPSYTDSSPLPSPPAPVYTRTASSDPEKVLALSTDLPRHSRQLASQVLPISLSLKSAPPVGLAKQSSDLPFRLIPDIETKKELSWPLPSNTGHGSVDGSLSGTEIKSESESGDDNESQAKSTSAILKSTGQTTTRPPAAAGFDDSAYYSPLSSSPPSSNGHVSSTRRVRTRGVSQSPIRSASRASHNSTSHASHASRRVNPSPAPAARAPAPAAAPAPARARDSIPVVYKPISQSYMKDLSDMSTNQENHYGYPSIQNNPTSTSGGDNKRAISDRRHRSLSRGSRQLSRDRGRRDLSVDSSLPRGKTSHSNHHHQRNTSETSPLYELVTADGWSSPDIRINFDSVSAAASTTTTKPSGRGRTRISMNATTAEVSSDTNTNTSTIGYASDYENRGRWGLKGKTIAPAEEDIYG